MTTLTATINPEGATVTLALDPQGASIAGITRSDANGNRSVRVPAGTFPRTTALTVIDFEAALTGAVTYSAATAVTAVELPATQPWLVFPLRPDYSLELELVSNYSASRSTLATFHQVPDRTDPLVALGRLAQRTGQLQIMCSTHAGARLLDSRLDLAGVCMLKEADHAGLDMYFVPNGTQVEYDVDSEAWTLSVDYTEITAPTSPISTNTWTFGTLATSYASFANVTSNYNDFEMLQINDQAGVV